MSCILLNIFHSIRFYVDCFIDYIFGLYWISRRKFITKPDNSLVLESATSLSQRIRKKEVSVEVVVNAFIQQIKNVNDSLNAVTDNRFDEAIKEAQDIDRRIASGSITDGDFDKKPFLDVEKADSEFGNKSEGSSLTGEEEWISVNTNMELQPLKEIKKSAPEEKPSAKQMGFGDKEEQSAPNAEENERDISVEDTHIRTLLRERFLKFIAKLPGQKCTVNFFEKTTQTCTIRACEPYFEDIVVEDLTTCYDTIPKAIIRVGDVISMHIEVDDIYSLM